MHSNLEIQEVPISGYAQHITLRCYRPKFEKATVPILVYCHGGGFVDGDLDESDYQASVLAEQIRAWVVSVGYSLAPAYPFPAAPEDVYLALQWAIEHAWQSQADSRRIAVAGHDAGASIATGVAAMARDRGVVSLAAQALIAPLLDPSITRLTDGPANPGPEADPLKRARQYKAYLPGTAQCVHPYAAPLDSRRLAGLPPTLIASAERDGAKSEGEQYAGRLIVAGVSTEARRYSGVCHAELPNSSAALDDVAGFLRRHLATRIGRASTR
ncbi:alpha/beta hydrolase [Cupriavidus sp. 30B13]|uniref:alpha/beta hydrolase n=1 Tax=Cupriavidus sp. 30B13 TaxID=3384241 RepID=UPI003B8F5C0F